MPLQSPRNQSISRSVAANFFKPEFAAGRRYAATRRVAVPKITVDENRQFDFRKNEIRTAKESRISPPTGDAMQPEKQEHL